MAPALSLRISTTCEPLPKNITQLLDERLGKGNLKLDEERVRQLLKNMPKNIDPKMFDEKTIKNLLEANPELKDAKNLERMRELIEKQLGGKQDFPFDKDKMNDLANTLKRFEEIQGQAKPSPSDPNVLPDSKNKGSPALKPPTSGPRPTLPGGNNKAVEQFARMFTKNFGESAATQDMVKEFAKLMSQDDKSNLPGLLSDLEKEWNSIKGSGESASSMAKFGDLLAGVSLPDFQMPNFGSNSSSKFTGGAEGHLLPEPSSSNTSGEWGDLSRVSMFIALAAGGFLLYWYAGVRAKNKPNKIGEAIALDWPVAPQLVSTREDVVKAFDFLSIAKCGSAAVNWHHRFIAETLSGQQPKQRDAVNQLAGLYEKARYAPVNEPFTESDLVAARTSLSQIAGETSR